MDDKLDKRQIERLIDEKVKKVISQYDILPDQIKSRHVGEGVRFIRTGTAANRPAVGEKAGAVYFESDTNILKVWNGTAWKAETLT